MKWNGKFICINRRFYESEKNEVFFATGEFVFFLLKGKRSWERGTIDGFNCTKQLKLLWQNVFHNFIWSKEFGKSFKSSHFKQLSNLMIQLITGYITACRITKTHLLLNCFVVFYKSNFPLCHQIFPYYESFIRFQYICKVIFFFSRCCLLNSKRLAVQ